MLTILSAYTTLEDMILHVFRERGNEAPPSFHQGWTLWFNWALLPLLFKWRAQLFKRPLQNHAGALRY